MGVRKGYQNYTIGAETLEKGVREIVVSRTQYDGFHDTRDVQVDDWLPRPATASCILHILPAAVADSFVHSLNFVEIGLTLVYMAVLCQ